MKNFGKFLLFATAVQAPTAFLFGMALHSDLVMILAALAGGFASSRFVNSIRYTDDDKRTDSEDSQDN